MFRYVFLILLILGVASSLLPQVVGAETPPKKNVLFLIADDLNTAVGCYGDPLVKTPNIDKLADRGVRFERAYCQYPLCNPSRTSFLTGLRPDTTGIYDNGIHFRNVVENTVTLPEFFRNQGYQVNRVGKLYHYSVPGGIGTSGLDDRQSWDAFFNPRGCDKDDEPNIFSLIPGQFGGTLSWYASSGSDEEQTDGIGATEAIRLLGEFKKTPEKPFFLAMGFYRPHTPYVAPKKYYDMYPVEKITLPEVPEVFRERTPDYAMMSRKKEVDLLTPDLAKQALQGYHAATTFMDAQLGRVVDALERLGLADNTLIVMTSDHGYHLGDHGLWQKQSIFERSARVPLIIIDPKNPKNGQTCPRIVEMLDLYPTITELCGFKCPEYLDGRSLKPLLDSPEISWNHPAITQVRRSPDVDSMGYAIRTEQYRYMTWGTDGRHGEQLYDYKTDPLENVNQIDNPEYAAIKKELKEKLASLVKPKNTPRSARNPQRRARAGAEQ